MATRKRRSAPTIEQPSAESLGREAQLAAKLADELALLAAEHATDLREAAILGAFVLVLGQIAGTIVREGRADFEGLMEFLGRQLTRATLGEFARRSLFH